MLVYRRLNMSERFFVNSQYMNKSFSSCFPFSSPSLNNSSEIVVKRVAFSFEGLEETFGECFFRSKKQAVFSTHDICLEVVRQRASRNPHRRGLLDLIVYNTFRTTYTVYFHIQHLDKNRQECFKFDLDWTLLPSELKEVSLSHLCNTR